jgi:formamidopyrimidine-DNA glycosylase
MPELPEVETVVRGLKSQIIGQKISSVYLSRKKMRIMPAANFEQLVTSLQITDVSRKAKYIVIHLANQTHIIVHLGMSGKLTLGVPKPDAKHLHANIQLANQQHLMFVDPRRFGFITHAEHLASFQSFQALGVEPLTDAFDADYLLQICSKKTQPIKTLIMDGKLIVGVGNIYASESLFHAGINPTAPANKLDKRQCIMLVAAIKQILLDAIASGGSTLRDYVRADGDSGYFQHHFKVYGKEGLECETCNAPIVKINQAGRSTFFCASCQR